MTGSPEKRTTAPFTSVSQRDGKACCAGEFPHAAPHQPVVSSIFDAVGMTATAGHFCPRSKNSSTDVPVSTVPVVSGTHCIGAIARAQLRLPRHILLVRVRRAIPVSVAPVVLSLPSAEVNHALSPLQGLHCGH